MRRNVLIVKAGVVTISGTLRQCNATFSAMFADTFIACCLTHRKTVFLMFAFHCIFCSALNTTLCGVWGEGVMCRMHYVVIYCTRYSVYSVRCILNAHHITVHFEAKFSDGQLVKFL